MFVFDSEMFIFGIRRFQKAKKPINIGTKIIRFRRTKKPDTSFNCLYSSRDVKNKQANNFGTKINAFTAVFGKLRTLTFKRQPPICVFTSVNQNQNSLIRRLLIPK